MMNLPWATWAIYPFVVLMTVVIVVWSYILQKKFEQEGDDM